MSGKHGKDEPQSLLLTGPIVIRGFGKGLKDALRIGGTSRHRSQGGRGEPLGVEVLPPAGRTGAAEEPGDDARPDDSPDAADLDAAEPEQAAGAEPEPEEPPGDTAPDGGRVDRPSDPEDPPVEHRADVDGRPPLQRAGGGRKAGDHPFDQVDQTAPDRSPAPADASDPEDRRPADDAPAEGGPREHGSVGVHGTGDEHRGERPGAGAGDAATADRRDDVDPVGIDADVAQAPAGPVHLEPVAPGASGGGPAETEAAAPVAGAGRSAAAAGEVEPAGSPRGAPPPDQQGAGRASTEVLAGPDEDVEPVRTAAPGTASPERGGSGPAAPDEAVARSAGREEAIVGQAGPGDAEHAEHAAAEHVGAGGSGPGGDGQVAQRAQIVVLGRTPADPVAGPARVAAPGPALDDDHDDDPAHLDPQRADPDDHAPARDEPAGSGGAGVDPTVAAPAVEQTPRFDTSAGADGAARARVPVPASPGGAAARDAPPPGPPRTPPRPRRPVAARPVGTAARRARLLQERLGREGLGIAVLVVLALVCAGLVVAVVQRTRDDATVSAREDAGRTPPPRVAPATTPPRPSSTPPGAASRGTVAVVGDETASSAASGVAADDRWPALLGDAVRARTVRRSATGAGYAMQGPSGRTFEQLVAEVPTDADVVVLVGGAADRDVAPLSVARAVSRTVAAVRDRAPGAEVVVVGPVVGGGVASADLIVLRNALRGAALAVDATWVDPIDDRWLDDAASLSPSDLTAAQERTISRELRPTVDRAL